MKRNEALGAEFGRFGGTLTNLTELSAETYAIETNDVPLLNEGLKSGARCLGNAQSLMEDEARVWDEGLLEDLKGLRDSLVSVREMFERWDRGGGNTIPKLEKRILANEGKLGGVRAKGAAAKAGEEEKILDAIVKVRSSVSCPLPSLSFSSLHSLSNKSCGLRAAKEPDSDCPICRTKKP